ncbi:MAG: AbrB/MazE/SpoVT family DNA-binding domain-containing protein [Pseudomonadota bacterium]
MYPERHVRLFRNGRNQAVRIPREFELDAKEAIMRREDDRLVIEPVRRMGLLATLASLPTLDEDFPDVDAGLPAVDGVDL